MVPQEGTRMPILDMCSIAEARLWDLESWVQLQPLQ